MPRDRWLSHDLSGIEVNSTFYRLPSESLLKSLSSLPRTTAIVLKLWRYITHMKLLKDIHREWKEFVTALGDLKSRVDVVLVQLPPRFGYSLSNMDRVIELKRLADRAGLRIAVEVRNSSWLNDKVYSRFRSSNICLVGTVIKKAKDDVKWLGTMPAGTTLPPATGDFTYTRFHGSKGYRGLYGVEELNRVKNRIKEQGQVSNYVFFNNAFYDYRTGPTKCPVTKTKAAAVCDAVMFKSLVARN